MLKALENIHGMIQKKKENLYLDPHKFYRGDLPLSPFNNKIVLANETHTIGFREHSSLLTNQIDNNFENN